MLFKSNIADIFSFFSGIINVYLALEHVWLQQLDVLYL